MTHNRRKRNVPVECPTCRGEHIICSVQDRVWGGRIWYGLCRYCVLKERYQFWNLKIPENPFWQMADGATFEGGSYRIPWKTSR